MDPLRSSQIKIKKKWKHRSAQCLCVRVNGMNYSYIYRASDVNCSPFCLFCKSEDCYFIFLLFVYRREER